MPLVVALHWGTQIYPHISADFLEQLVQPGLEELGAVIVAPDRIGASWANPEGEKYVIDMFQSVGRGYGLDPRTSILMGYSMGGLGCWHIGQRHQDLFRAMIPMASTPAKEVAGEVFQVPVYVIHGRRDEIFPCDETQAIVGALRSRGDPVELSIVEGATHFEVGSYIKPLRMTVPWIRGILTTDRE